MDKRRQELYACLEEEIGNTPLYKMVKLPCTRSNQIFVKEENKNPGGSHYDRVFIKLFKHYEKEGKIIPGYTPVVETTSGSAGVSFARLGRRLGYECLVICPEDLPENRIKPIREQGAQIRTSPGGKYVDGSAEELAKIFREENKQRKAEVKVPYFGLNHTQGESARISAQSVESVVDEAVKQAEEFGIKFDLMVSAAGNGTTALGFGIASKRHGIHNIVWEPLGCGVYYNRKYGIVAHKEKFGIRPGELGYHKIYGVHFKETPYSLPNLDKVFEEGLVDDVVIITDEDIKKRALKILPEPMENPYQAPDWWVGIFDIRDSIQMETLKVQRDTIIRTPMCEDTLYWLISEGKPVGRSSAGNIAAVQGIIRTREMENSNILTFFYDDLSRY